MKNPSVESNSNEKNHSNAPGIDGAKRHTLKMAAASAGVAVAVASPVASAVSGLLSPLAGERPTIDNSNLDLAEFTVEVQHAWAANDLEVVIRNTGPQASVITAMTPGLLSVARGHFDFDVLLANGPLLLGPGESVSVALQHGTITPGTNGALGHFDNSLQKRLRATMSIVTEGTALASVTIPSGPRLV